MIISAKNVDNRNIREKIIEYVVQYWIGKLQFKKMAGNNPFKEIFFTSFVMQ